MAALAASDPAAAHSASDAYLNLTAETGSGRTVIHGQWDIALRDLDFVLGLDDNGDGHLTWGEVRTHQTAIERYAYRYLQIGNSGTGCAVRPVRQMIDEHADGAYVALFFDAVCPPAKTLTVDYSLFFAIDPSHRGIFVMRTAADVATSVLSPQNPKIFLSL